MLSAEQLSMIRQAGCFCDDEIKDLLVPALTQGINHLVSLYKKCCVPNPLKKDISNYQKQAVRRSLEGRKAVSDELFTFFSFCLCR